MAFEVRVNGASVGQFASHDEAVDCVRRIVKEQVDSEPEIVDSETGKAVSPASSRRWRDQIANEVGY